MFEGDLIEGELEIGQVSAQIEQVIPAKAIIKEFIEIFNDTTADVIYETPNYKVWVGNYYTQLEADKRLLEIRKKFRSAFIFRPEFQEIFEGVIDEKLDQDKLIID